MTRVVLLLLVVLTARVVLAEDPIYFADPNLKAAVEEALGVPDPNATDMLTLTHLTASDRGVFDLTGLEFATNAVTLNFAYNNITDISPLAGLAELEELILYRNHITDISPLSSLMNLTYLRLENNYISDVSPISGLTNLTELYLHYNQINDISALSGMTKLITLFALYNQISNISPLSELTKLNVLRLEVNQISDISALSGLTDLTVLYLHYNQISKISALSELTNLTELYLTNNPLDESAYCVYLSLIQTNNPVMEMTYDPAPPTLDCNSLGVALDIKPQSCPNPLNLKSRGVFPATILGAEDFDVNTVDATSIRLAGVAPIRSSYEDVATPVSDGNECECTPAGPDGYTDINLKFRTQEIVEELVDGPGDLIEDHVLVLTLTGQLLDGTLIAGSDCVVLVGNVSKWLAAKDSDINEDGRVDFHDFAELATYWLESESY